MKMQMIGDLNNVKTNIKWHDEKDNATGITKMGNKKMMHTKNTLDHSQTSTQT